MPPGSELKVHSSSNSVLQKQKSSGIKKSFLNLPCSDLFEESDEESYFNQPKVPLNSPLKNLFGEEDLQSYNDSAASKEVKPSVPESV